MRVILVEGKLIESKAGRGEGRGEFKNKSGKVISGEGDMRRGEGRRKDCDVKGM